MAAAALTETGQILKSPRSACKKMIAVDTNILARFYCDGTEDGEAKRERPMAPRLISELP